MGAPREIFSTFCGLFLLLNNSILARFLVKVGQQVSHYSPIFDEVQDIFLWSGIGV